MTTVVWDSPVPELSESLMQYVTLVLKFLTFPPRPAGLYLGSNTKENLGETALRNMKNLRTRTHTSFVLAYFWI